MTEQKANADTQVAMDTELSRLVVEKSLATAEEVAECLKVQSAEGDSQRSFAQILVDCGVVTAAQLKRLKRSIEATIEATRTQQIPGYRILGKLGSGAMATVVKAVQLSLDRTVAIKVLPRKLSENADYVEMFYKEGKAAAKLNHANIVQAYDVGESGGYHYFVMEYVEGHTLFDELAKGEVFEEDHAVGVIIQVARALEHAHRQNLIHRDVKPKNIIIDTSGRVKLADMGLARRTNDPEAAQAEAGRAFGTPYYISPEQIRGRVDIDARADIYSLGATLYHLVTGKVPFEGPTPAAVMHKHLKDALVPPDHVNTNLSAGLGEVVEVMMAKSRRHRYESVSDLLVDLEAIAAGDAPPLARKQIDAGVLSGLAQGDQSSLDTQMAPSISPAEPKLRQAVVLLSLALGASLVLIVALLVYLIAQPT